MIYERANLLTWGLKASDYAASFSSDDSAYVVQAEGNELRLVLPPIEATAEDVSVTYDGKAHGIAVAVTDPEDGYEVKYGESADACTLDASPTVTNVADGPKTVWYKVSAAGYADATGSATVAVTKAPSSVKAAPEATNPTYTGAARALSRPVPPRAAPCATRSTARPSPRRSPSAPRSSPTPSGTRSLVTQTTTTPSQRA